MRTRRALGSARCAVETRRGQPNGMYLRERKESVSFPCGTAQGRFAASPGTTFRGNGGRPGSRSTNARVSREPPHEGTAEICGCRTHAPSTSGSKRAERRLRGRSINKIEGEHASSHSQRRPTEMLATAQLCSPGVRCIGSARRWASASVSQSKRIRSAISRTCRSCSERRCRSASSRRSFSPWISL